MVCYNCFKEKSSYGPCPFCGYDPAGAEEKYPLALKAGSILNGRYTVGRVIGQGGFGITYIAQDYQTKERVAIKEFLPTDFAGRDSASSSVKIYSGERRENFEYGKEQFLQEAKTLAAFIGDEHIVRIYSYFEENNTAYFVMEYVDGYALDKYMAQKGGRLSVEEANHLLLPLMQSLDKVHAKGIIHRDIAPDNIIVTNDGNAKLIDFGAARYSTGEKSKSLDVILKHGFAPREQYTRRGRQGPFTDVYALAATYYYAITGKVPPDAIDRIDDDILLSPSSLGIRIPQCTEDALYKGLEVNSGNRYQRMSEFYRDMAEGSNVISDSSVERTGTDSLTNTTSRTEQEAKERAERLERELQAAKEEAARLEQERLEREAREAAARRERERKEREAREEAAHLERERIERERKEEEARKKAERLEAERKAREEAERRKREVKEAEERRKKELAEQKAREEAERQEKLRLEREKREEEKRLAAEKKRQEAAEKERLRQEAIAKRKAEQEQQHLEAEGQKRKREEQKCVASEQKKQTVSEKTVSSKKTVIAIIAALLIAAIAVGYFISSGSKKPAEEIPLQQEAVQPAPTAEQAKPTAELPEQLEPEQHEPTEQAEEQTEPEEKIEEQPGPVEEKTEQSEHAIEQTEQPEHVEQPEAAEPEKTPEDYYAEGVALQAAGEWNVAIAAFTNAGDYEDSGEHIQEIQKELRYQEATDLLVAGKYREALTSFEDLKAAEFKDSAEKTEEIKHLAAYLAQVWSDPQVGDIIYFGNYEQDNDLTNGKEEIEWLVLDKEEDRILVISKYSLDCQQYNTSNKECTWETCSLRSWLDKKFINEAFSAEELKKIPTITVNSGSSSQAYTQTKKEIPVSVFLLNTQEAEKYFNTKEERQSIPTAYTKERGHLEENTEECIWWLRSLRSVEGYEGQFYDFTNIGHHNAAIDYDGSVQKNKFRVDSDYITVRPVVWIDITGMADKYFIQAEEEHKAAEFAASLQTVGKTVIFGHYEQDNDQTNGKEPIEWIVLDKQDGKSLLLSKYALDSKQFHETKNPVNWDTCSLRRWLNNDFFKEAFSQNEQKVVVYSYVDNSVNQRNPATVTSPGSNTSDYVFLLSYAEAKTYLDIKTIQICEPTDFAVAQGINKNKDNYSWWWLRSSGEKVDLHLNPINPQSRHNYVDTVSSSGILGNRNYADNKQGALRPVIWVNSEKLDLLFAEEQFVEK